MKLQMAAHANQQRNPQENDRRTRSRIQRKAQMTISVEELDDAIKLTKRGKAPGPDSIRMELLNMVA